MRVACEVMQYDIYKAHHLPLAFRLASLFCALSGMDKSLTAVMYLLCIK